MKLHSLLAIAFLTAFDASAFAAAQRSQPLGSLSRVQAVFDRMDVDGDDILSPDEVTAVGVPMGHIEQHDSNGDLCMSADEFAMYYYYLLVTAAEGVETDLVDEVAKLNAIRIARRQREAELIQLKAKDRLPTAHESRGRARNLLKRLVQSGDLASSDAEDFRHFLWGKGAEHLDVEKATPSFQRAMGHVEALVAAGVVGPKQARLFETTLERGAGGAIARAASDFESDDAIVDEHSEDEFIDFGLDEMGSEDLADTSLMDEASVDSDFAVVDEIPVSDQPWVELPVEEDMTAVQPQDADLEDSGSLRAHRHEDELEEALDVALGGVLLADPDSVEDEAYPDEAVSEEAQLEEDAEAEDLGLVEEWDFTSEEDENTPDEVVSDEAEFVGPLEWEDTIEGQAVTAELGANEPTAPEQEPFELPLPWDEEEGSEDANSVDEADDIDNSVEGFEEVGSSEAMEPGILEPLQDVESTEDVESPEDFGAAVTPGAPEKDQGEALITPPAEAPLGLNGPDDSEEELLQQSVPSGIPAVDLDVDIAEEPQELPFFIPNVSPPGSVGASRALVLPFRGPATPEAAPAPEPEVGTEGEQGTDTPGTDTESPQVEDEDLESETE